jgi:two-component system cell cycle sensor histidine kinase/response regulator CckA
MDAATQARIFDPFFTTKATGRGLGLSAVLGVVRAHEGAIKVDSTPGVGSAIRVIFPSSGQPASRNVPAPSLYRGQGLALLIDDDPCVRHAIRDMLTGLGFSVIDAANGRQGVALYREQSSRVAVVIVDMTMPEMGGEETFMEIRRRSDVPVILMSGYAEVDGSAQSATKSACLHKPFTRAELSQTLRLVLPEAVRG